MLAFALSSLLAAAPAPDAPFADFAFFIGRCWRSASADGVTDTHCFEPFLAPHFLRDRHVVCAGGKAVYSGETTYRKSADGKSTLWRYLSSAGLVMDGRVESDGIALQFTGASESSAGRSEIRARWGQIDGGYSALTEARQPDGSWKQPAYVEFMLVADGPPCEARRS